MTLFKIDLEPGLRTACIHPKKGVIATQSATDRGETFSPTDLVALALGSCVLTVIGIVAERLQISLTGLHLTVEKEMVTLPARRLGRLTLNIYCPQTFSPEVTQKLEKAGIQCPVHHTLHPDIEQQFIFHWGEA